MKLNKLNLSIKTRFSFQTIALKLVYALIGAIILLAFIAPYLNIFLDKTSTVKVFGFKNFRTFTYVIGLPSSLMVCSFLLLYISLKTKYSIGRLASYLFLYSSFFSIHLDFLGCPRFTQNALPYFHCCREFLCFYCYKILCPKKH